MSVNKVILVGNVGQDPDVKEIGNGNKVAKFSLATTDRYKKDGEPVEQTEWHNVEAWGKLAEIVENYVKKGKQVYLEGKLKTESWEEDGVKKFKTKVVAANIQLLGKKDD